MLTGDDIVKKETLDEHPNKHGGAGVLEDNVKPFAQYRLFVVAN